MKTTTKKVLQIVKFKEPKLIKHEIDQYGCTGFWSYGYIQHADHSVEHVKNPDFGWKAYKAANR